MPSKRKGDLNVEDGDARGKRRKESEIQSHLDSSSPAADIETIAEPNVSRANTTNLDLNQVRELGLKLWNAVKDTKGKEEQELSFDFMRLPSKRQYADYYVLIKQPICLEDIKLRLESFHYLDLEAVKQDFELCFKNARKYNRKESGIYKAAKSLQKVVSAEYSRLTGSEDFDVDVVGDDMSGDEGGDRKKKKHSLSRTLKGKLNKLCEKTDDDGRILSNPFMEPPDRKVYSDYYKIIKKVMCFEMIYKKIKRKEYFDVNSFIADVELIFSNAIEYNADHSMIWEDAHTLREYFRMIMESLPLENPGALGTSQSSGKIKLKLPAAASRFEPSIDATANTLTLKLPATNRAAVQPDSSASDNVENIPAVAQSVQSQQGSSSSAPTGKPLLSAQPTVPAATSVGSRGMFPVKSASPAPNLPLVSQTVAKQSTPQPQSYTPSPAPPELPMKHPIQSMVLHTTPQGRTFHLDREEGVRLWAVRLGAGERGIRVSQLHFAEDSNQSDGDEDDEAGSGDEEPSHNKSRRKGGLKDKDKNTNDKKEKGQKDGKVAMPDATVRLNGALLRSTNGSHPMKGPELKPSKQWQGDLPVGTNNLEIRAGEVGEIWKIYLERQSG